MKMNALHGSVTINEEGHVEIYSLNVCYTPLFPDEEQRLLRARMNTDQKIWLFYLSDMYDDVTKPVVGFTSPHGRSWFRTLMAVEGIGIALSMKIYNVFNDLVSFEDVVNGKGLSAAAEKLITAKVCSDVRAVALVESIALECGLLKAKRAVKAKK